MKEGTIASAISGGPIAGRETLYRDRTDPSAPLVAHVAEDDCGCLVGGVFQWESPLRRLLRAKLRVRTTVPLCNDSTAHTVSVWVLVEGENYSERPQ